MENKDGKKVETGRHCGMTADYVSKLFHEICEYIQVANPVLSDALAQLDGETDEDSRKKRATLSVAVRNGELLFSALKPLSHWEEGIGGVVHGGKM